MQDKLDYIINNCYRFTPYLLEGKVITNSGPVLFTTLTRASIGSMVKIITTDGKEYSGEVIGIRDTKACIMSYQEIPNINSETLISLLGEFNGVSVCESMLGRILDFKGMPIDLDSLGPLEGPFKMMSIFGEEINPLMRPVIDKPLDTGIKVINSFLTLGKGQRIAIMAGSGVGKSVLLGMLARNSTADVNVVALIGERGREVREFIEKDLGEEGLKKSILVVATSDASPMIRIRAAYVATTIAEYFRDKGKDVNLMMDSVTRFCMAYREVSLAAGEIPGQRGHPPSVFSKLPKLLERCGTKKNSGTITGIYTVLVEGGDLDEPVADSVRSIVDGHFVLSRDLATKNHFPSIDVLESISRVMSSVISKDHKLVVNYLRDLLAAYRQNEDLINVGAYVMGSNDRVDKALKIYQQLMSFLRQDIDETMKLEDCVTQLVKLSQSTKQLELSQDELQAQGKLESTFNRL